MSSKKKASYRFILIYFPSLVGLFLISSGARAQQEGADRFMLVRKDMVEYQIKARGIKNSWVLDAMLKVPRHEFVPERLQDVAYTDGPLPIGEDQTISQPYIVALMTELLEIRPGEKVLEIGTGSGYQAAVLAEITPQVFTIEILEPLYDQAKRTLNHLGYSNIQVKLGDGTLGWPEHAPFDKIIVTAAARSEIPQPLIEQLKDKGKIVIPIGEDFQELIVAVKEGGRLMQKSVIPVRFVPLVSSRKG